MNIEEVKNDPGFNKFVDEVSPKEKGVQKVFLAELLLVLKVLFTIYELLQGMGFFQKFFAKARVKAAMRNKTPEEKEAALKAVRARYSDVVPV